MSVLTAYRANYDRIAADHVKFWRETVRNPFQEEGIYQRHLNATEFLLRQYVTDGDAVLDAGCGMGDLLDRFPNLSRYGVDISADYLAIAADRGILTHRGLIERMPYRRGMFDAVVCTDVLEHVLDLNACVKELLRVLKREGVLVVRVPNDEPVDMAMGGTYEFVHLRRLDEQTLRILFQKIFRCEVVETSSTDEVVYMVVRKP